jgi:hypothetical protein
MDLDDEQRGGDREDAVRKGFEPARGHGGTVVGG